MNLLMLAFLRLRVTPIDHDENASIAANSMRHIPLRIDQIGDKLSLDRTDGLVLDGKLEHPLLQVSGMADSASMRLTWAIM